jgi:hypothetical protein
LTTQSYVLVASETAAVTTVSALIAAAKARPGELRFGSTGVGTGTHLGIEKSNLAAGINATHVPARGSDAIADTIANVIAGRTDYALSPIPTTLPLRSVGVLSRRQASSSQPERIVHHWTGPDQDGRLPQQWLEQSLHRRPEHLQARHGVTLGFPNIQGDRAAVVGPDHQRAAKSGLALMDGVEFCELLMAACGQSGLIVCEFAYHGVHRYMFTCAGVDATWFRRASRFGLLAVQRITTACRR